MMNDRVRRVREFHGHLCPGVIIGVRAAEVALREIGPHSPDEEVVAIVETDMCAVDAIQLLTGCTFGKGNLIHRDYGKNAYTFVRRSDGKAVRIVTRPGAWPARNPEHQTLGEQVGTGKATESEVRRYWELQEERALAILDIPEERLFELGHVEVDVPPRARSHDSIQCEECDEETMETRIRIFAGRTLCIPCFRQAEAR